MLRVKQQKKAEGQGDRLEWELVEWNTNSEKLVRHFGNISHYHLFQQVARCAWSYSIVEWFAHA